MDDCDCTTTSTVSVCMGENGIEVVVTAGASGVQTEHAADVARRTFQAAYADLIQCMGDES